MDVMNYVTERSHKGTSRSARIATRGTGGRQGCGDGNVPAPLRRHHGGNPAVVLASPRHGEKLHEAGDAGVSRTHSAVRGHTKNGAGRTGIHQNDHSFQLYHQMQFAVHYNQRRNTTVEKKDVTHFRLILMTM